MNHRADGSNIIVSTIFNNQEQVADACECGNEPSASVKCGEFLD